MNWKVSYAMLHVGRHNKEIRFIFVDMMKKAEQKNMMHLVIEGNVLKTKSEEKVEQLFVLKRRVEELQIKKKTLV